MPQRQLVHLVLASLVFPGCFNATGCALGALGVHIPDAGNIDDLEFNAIVGDGLAFPDGGHDVFGGMTFDVTIDGGAYILQVNDGSGVSQTLVYPNGTDSLIHGIGDIDHDGRTDWLFEGAFDPATSKQTSTILTDANLDGVIDTRDVWVVDTTTWPLTKTETLSRWRTPDGGISTDADAGSWVDSWTYTGDAVANYLNPTETVAKTAEGCGLLGDGISNFPDVEGYTGSLVRLHPPSTQIVILNDNEGKGGCTDAQTQVLIAGFEAALKDAATCFSISNPDVARTLKTALVGRRLYVACNNDCPGTLASTDLPYSAVGSSNSWRANGHIASHGYQRMNVSPGIPFSHTDVPWMEEILLHELLHFAGIDHNPAPAGNPVGHDLVYAAGRYCSGCKAFNGNPTVGWPGGVRPTAAMYAFDCVDVSDGVRQAACGSGLLDVPHCSKDDCAIRNSQCESCCEITPLNCWADGVIDPGQRDVKLIPHKTDACEQTCSGVGDPCCTSQFSPAAFDARACGGAGLACGQFPVAFCPE